MCLKCPNGCGLKGPGLISVGRTIAPLMSAWWRSRMSPVRLFPPSRLNQDERASGAVSVGDDPACLLSACSCCLTPGHECGCNYTIMGFFGGNNCSQAGGTIRRRGGKTAIDAFLLPLKNLRDGSCSEGLFLQISCQGNREFGGEVRTPRGIFFLTLI